MSDNWIILIPEDPGFVPEPSRHQLAVERFAAIAPRADEITVIVKDHIGFFDCGTNFEHVACPACGEELTIDWWHERMDEDFDGSGFQLKEHYLECCGCFQLLNSLLYKRPQGFARFAIEGMNPDIGELSKKQIQEFETILGTPLRVLHRHL